MKKYIKNIVWLSLERLIAIFGSLATTIYIARYLGPEKMGVFNFSIALIALIEPICRLGSDTLIFNRVAKNRKKGVVLLKSTLRLRFFIYLLLSTTVFLYGYFQDYPKENLIILFLMMVSCLFSSQDIYRFYFDAQLKSKFNSISTLAGLYTSITIRIVLIKIQASLLFFSIPYIAESIIPFTLRKIKFSKETNNLTVSKKSQKKYNRYLLNAGLPLLISSLSIVIYMRISQVMLGELLSTKTVGIYSAAISIGQGWGFVPIAIITTLMTTIIIDKKTFIQGISFLYLTSIVTALPIIGLFFYFSNEIIFYTYGSAYREASEFLPLVALSTMFGVMGTVSYRAIVVLAGYKFLMYKMLTMALMNILLSFQMITYYGLNGAFYSLIITEIISCTIANYFFKKGIIFKSQLCVLKSFSYIKTLIALQK